LAIVSGPAPEQASEQSGEQPGELDRARDGMLATIRSMFAELAGQALNVPLAPEVEQAMRTVPRHRFYEGDWHDAYLNRPLPIGYRQTLSQPFIVALMTQLLRVTRASTVLEIGTGSGYQTAVLAHLAKTVYTIEIVAPLAERAATAFEDLALHNIVARTGDGYGGWPEAAPFDAILAAASPDRVPDALVRQLKPGARLVMPVGGARQKLIVVEMQSDLSVSRREIIPVSFVPLVRAEDPGEARED
jgi:protein-L-isoaspartate(D-aspartate) O-methyltransferase